VDANIAQRLRSRGVPAHARHDSHAWRNVQRAFGGGCGYGAARRQR
jgi:hypothetical protein